MSTIIPETVASRILLLRGQRVMLDADLAELYGVTTKRLNEQVKRNIERFPGDFMFQLNVDEKAEVVANCDHLAKLKFSPSLPYAFTEHGALMLGNVLKSSRAVEVSLLVVRAFVQIREMLSAHKDISAKLDQMERKSLSHEITSARCLQNVMVARRRAKPMVVPLASPTTPQTRILEATRRDGALAGAAPRCGGLQGGRHCFATAPCAASRQAAVAHTRSHETDSRLSSHDQAIAGLIDAIRQLMNPPAPARRGIGFTANIDSKPGKKK